MSSLINAGEGVDVDLHLHREIRGKTIDRVAQRIRLNRTKLRELQDTSTDYEELAGSIQAGYYIKQGLSSRNEDLFYMSVLITISAPTYEELQWRKQQMSDLMKSMDIQVGDCLFQQEAALRSTMPFLYLDPGLERKSKRNVLTSGAASTYMFTSEQHLTRLLQPQEDLRYILVLPHINMAQELVLPSAPHLFATVDYNGQETPDVRFFTESEGDTYAAV